MENSEENRTNILKRKKPNIFQRFSHRISKYFHRSKAERLSKNDGGLSRSSLTDLPATSKSHDDLSRKKGKKERPGETLDIPKTSNRCLSEGDLTRDDGQFYSQDTSSKAFSPQAYDSSTNESSKNESNVECAFSHKNGHLFKNELALKLRAKSQVKDNESEHSKTPDSPTRYVTGTSPSRQGDTDLRTPRSMSSLSQSSNSLLSGTPATTYGLSDGESMSRSMIDSSDDIGIVVDLATPICKTTTASLLDSTAARQKIAASKARRARPKALGTVSGDNTSVVDGAQFSPVREKRDILEEIREEECVQSPNTPEIPEDVTLSPTKRPCSFPSKDHSSEETSLTTKRLSGKSQSSEEDLPSLNETGDFRKDKLHSLSKEAKDPSLDSRDSSSKETTTSKSPGLRSVVKTRLEVEETKERTRIKSSSESDNALSQEKHVLRPLSDTGDSLPLKEKVNTKAAEDSVSKHGVMLNSLINNEANLSSVDKHSSSSSTDVDEKKQRFGQNKSKFQVDSEKSEVTSRFSVRLRPVGSSLLENNAEKCEQKVESNVALHNLDKSTIAKETEISSNPSKEKDAPHFNRYVPLRKPKVTNTSETGSSLTTSEDCLVTPGLTVNDKRASKVLDMVKNLEGVSCSDSH